jgi:lactate permease
MYAVAAFLPIVLVIVLMGVLRWGSGRVLPLTWLLTAALSIAMWGIPASRVLAQSVFGALQALDILVIVFGAVLLLNTLDQSGAMRSIQAGFERISPDARIQALILGFAFVSFLEGAAGFGTPAALAAPLLVGLRWPAVAAAYIALVFDSVSVVYGAAGTPMAAAFSSVRENVEQAGTSVATFNAGLTGWVALPNAIVALFLPALGLCLTMGFFGDRPSRRDLTAALPFAFLTGVSFAVPYVLVAHLAGPELPSLLAALVCLATQVIAARRGFLVPKDTWHFPNGGTVTSTSSSGSPSAVVRPRAAEAAGATHSYEPTMPLWRAWAPYVFVAAILTVTRIPALGLREPLRAQALHVPDLFGLPDLDYSFRWAYLPGILPFLVVAILTRWLHRMAADRVRAAWRKSFDQVAKAVPALVFGVAVVQVMLKSGDTTVVLSDGAPLGSMVQTMAGVAAQTGPVYAALAPLVGALGAFLAGSATVSNLLFASFQFETATNLGYSPLPILAAQCSGAALGNMVCIVNIVAVSATVGLVGRESEILRRTAVPAAVYALVVAGFTAIAVAVGV